MKITSIIAESQHKCPHCGGPVVEYSELMEKKDACYYKVKASAKVWPSAYASGRLVQCRKKGAGNYGKKNESVAEAANSAQQAAIAIAKKKKAGVKEAFTPVNEGMPVDNDMGATPSGAKMTLGQWKQMWMKKMPNADFAAMFRSPPSMPGSAIAYFDGWMNNPDARWDPQRGVAEAIRPIPVDDQGNRIPDRMPNNKPKRPFGQPGDAKSSSKGVVNYTPTGLIHSSNHGDVTPRPRAVPEDANPDYIWIQGDFDGDTATTGSKQGSWRDQQTTQVELTRGRMSNVRPLSGPPPEGGKTIKQAQIPLTLDAGNTKFSTTGVDLQLTVAPNGYISQGGVGRVRGTAVVKIMRPGNVAEGTQQVDSLVTDALKIMRGSEASDAVAALKTVLGDREYNSRRGYYNFYVRQLLDMLGQQGMAEGNHVSGGRMRMNDYYKLADEIQEKLKQAIQTGNRELVQQLSRQRDELDAQVKKHGMIPEDYNPEYDDEAGMVENNLETLDRAVEGLDDLINSGDNLPEWCQEKIAVAKSMLVAVWDYMYSEESSDEVDPEIDEMFEAMDQLAEEMALKKGVSVDLVWESFEALDDNMLYETAAWRRKEGKSKKGGLNAKGVASYRRENPGSKLQTAVTTKPSKLKPGSKAAKRRKSFCARMGGVKGPMKKPNGKPTRKALALRKWNC